MKRTLLVLILAGCSSPASAPVAEKPKPEAPVVIQAQDPEWQKLAEELTKGMTVAEQQKALEGQRHYDLALAWFNKGDFEKAKVEAQIAIGKSPEHIAARKLLSDVNEILSGRPTGLRTPAEQELSAVLSPHDLGRRQSRHTGSGADLFRGRSSECHPAETIPV